MKLVRRNQDGSPSWEAELAPGTVLVGRESSCSIQIDHPSVSSSHCELTVAENGVRIRDLGSTNGTFVDEEPIVEAELHPGQVLRLGEVSLALTPTVRVVAKPSVARPITRTVAPVSAPPKMAEAEGSFQRTLLAAFVYPLNAEGLSLMLLGALLFALLNAVRWVSRYAGIIGLLAIIFVTLFGVGYLFSFLKSIILASAAGEDALPNWPEFSNIGSDIVSPFIQCVGLFLACFAPGLVWLVWGPETGKVFGAVSLLGLGLIYLPMGLLGVSLFDSLAALNPMLVINSILRILGHYCIACLFLLVVVLVRVASVRLAHEIPVPLVPSVASEFLAFYFYIVVMRVLGTMYYVNRSKLGWFARA